MKPKVLVLTVVLLLMAMVPTFVMAKSQAKPERTGTVVLDTRLPLGPQLDAQLGVSSRGPRSFGKLNLSAPSGRGVQPNAVYGNILDNFEPPTYAFNWNFQEAGLSWVGWDASPDAARGGDWSLYSAGFLGGPTYDNDMESYAWRNMDLQGATRVQTRFYYMSDTEFGWDYFYWCSTDGFWLYCNYHTGSTNGKWRQVRLDSRTDPGMASILGSPFAGYVFLFESDFIFVDRGTFVDQFHMRAWGPQPRDRKSVV